MPMIYRCVCYPRNSQWDSLNLDLDERNILFHLSIRLDRAAIILSDLVDGVWGIERVLPLDQPMPEILPLTLLVEAQRIHLMMAGAWCATVALRLPYGPGVTVRASIPWSVSLPFGPFVAHSGAAWLPAEGIGAASLHGFLDAPGWAGGAVNLAIGGAHFAAQALPAPGAEAMPQGFVVPLDPTSRAALAQAAAETRRPTAIVISFGNGCEAEGWLNAPGLVETFREGRFSGWLNARGALPQLELLADGVPVPALPQLGGEPPFPGGSLIVARYQHERADGGDGYAPERRIAFTLDLPAGFRARSDQPVMLALRGDGALLPGGEFALDLGAIASLRPSAVADDLAEIPGEVPRPHDFAMAVEIDGFVLRGEVPGSSEPRIGLRLGGVVLDVAVSCWPEAGEPPRHSFEIELPGMIWCGLAAEQGAVLDVTLDDRLVEPSGIRFTRAMARDALVRAAQRGDATPQAQAEALLALEHLAFGRFLASLPAEAAEHHRDFARRMKLEGFLHREDPPAPSLPIGHVPPRPEDPVRLAVWRALRAVSEAMTADTAPVMDLALRIAAEAGLAGEAREHFWVALVPNLSETDELPRLAEAVPLATWFAHEQKAEAWALSCAIALLAAAGEARRATDALYRLAGCLEGWINTACIGFALRRLEQLAAEEVVPAAELERFHYAFLGLLDAFKGEWFSRLHDRHLVQGLLRLLDRRPAMPDYLAHDVASAALRHYGLSPTFWNGWAQGAAGRGALPDSLMSQTHRRFRTLQAGLASPAQIDARLGQLHAATQFFRAQRNPDALIWQRELAAHAMRPGSAAPAGAVTRLVADLAAADARDAVRIAASPGTPPPGGSASLGIGPQGIRDLLRAMRPQPHGLADRAQRALCQALTEVAPDARTRARPLAEMLADARYFHVGAYALSLLVVREPAGSALAVELLGRFGTAVLRAVAECADPYLPAPILAGLARLGALPEGGRLAPLDAVMPKVLGVLHGAIAEHFGARHATALARVAQPALDCDPAALAGDVLVCVYSCNNYLDSRVAAIRASWMRDLAAIGARCIVVVGDGDDTLDGDVLRLAVSDLYEDLPAKTLRMVEWVHANTNAQLLIKIDDDCALSVENYFGTLDHRAYHYYGRLLERPIGGMDRVWHHLKSTSARARSIDRSPEPSVYCDGGGVYALSRYAMGALGAAARGRAGQLLIARSFMEDKLVGDLLALEGIAPANTDYESYQRRRTFGAAHPIGIYENTFFPSALAPAKVVHLDRAEDQARAVALHGRMELAPKKLWPSFTAIGTDYAAHQLELLSEGDALARAQAAPVGVVLAARNEMTMLPHLLAHYRGLGVRAFYAVDNASDDGSREWLLAQPDVVVYSAASDYRTSHYGVTWQQTVLGHHFLGRWAVVADADEFLIYPGWRDRKLADFIVEVEAEGADAVPLWMADMYPFGSLEEADFTARPPFEAAPFLDRVPVTPSRLTTCFYSNRVQQVSALRHRLLPNSEPNSFVAEKVAMLRYLPWVRLSEGLHSAANLRVSQQRAVFAHFKYHAGFRRKILEEIARGQHYNSAAEYRRYAAMLAEGSGGFGRAGLSVELGADGFPSHAPEVP